MGGRAVCYPTLMLPRACFAFRDIHSVMNTASSRGFSDGGQVIVLSERSFFQPGYLTLPFPPLPLLFV